MRSALSLMLAALLLGLPVGVEAAPRSQVVRGEGGARIVVYDSLCDEDNAVECLIAEIGCGMPGEFTAGLYNLNAKEAAGVFAKGNGKGVVAAGAARFPLQVSKVALSEHSYNWDVTLLSLEQAAAIWGAVWNAGEVQLQAGTRTAVLRRADIGEDGFREVVSACAVAR